EPAGVDVALLRRERVVAGDDAGRDDHVLRRAAPVGRLELDAAAGAVGGVVGDRAVEDVEVGVRAGELHHDAAADAGPVPADGRAPDDVRVPAAAEGEAAARPGGGVADDRRVVDDQQGAEACGR